MHRNVDIFKKLPKYLSVWGPPEHSAIGNVHRDIPPNTLPLVMYIGTFCFCVLLHYNLLFKMSIGGFNCAFWWCGALSEDQDKSLMNLPKLSCGFNTWKCDSIFKGLLGVSWNHSFPHRNPVTNKRPSHLVQEGTYNRTIWCINLVNLQEQFTLNH